MFSVLVIRLRSLRLLRVSGIVMRLRMFLLLITFLKASHSFRNRLLVICKNAYLFATMIMTSVSSPFSCCSGIVRLDRKSGSAGMPRPISYAVFCLKKKIIAQHHERYDGTGYLTGIAGLHISLVPQIVSVGA